MTVFAFQMCALEDAVENWMDNDTPVCARCGESFDDAGDGDGELCPTCADAHEDAFERGLAMAHDGISDRADICPECAAAPCQCDTSSETDD